jgi:hypothetical protein
MFLLFVLRFFIFIFKVGKIYYNSVVNNSEDNHYWLLSLNVSWLIIVIQEKHAGLNTYHNVVVNQ